MTQGVVLDASALLAYLLAEPGAERVRAHLDGSFISTVNWVEVLSKLVDLGGDLARIELDLRNQGIIGQIVALVPFDEAQAREAARIRPATRAAGLSLGDQACLALALKLECPVLTADRCWATLDLNLDVRHVRD